MHDYKLMKEDNTTLLFNSCFVDDEDIEYAYKHRFNILYTETSCCDTFKLINKLMSLGYTLEVIEKPVTWQGLKFNPLLHAKFIHPDNSHYDENLFDFRHPNLSDVIKYVKSQYASLNCKIKEFDQLEHESKIKVAVYEPSLEELIGERNAFSRVLGYVTTIQLSDKADKQHTK